MSEGAGLGSYGCGTLAAPGGLDPATKFANSTWSKGRGSPSSSTGKQHRLPLNPGHTHLDRETIDAHWDPKQPKKPTRLWGTVKSTKMGGEERIGGQDGQTWYTGTYYNPDSNIVPWTDHEIRRNAAMASHDVHRHDQIQRLVLPPQPGQQHKPPRACISGVVTPDCCFLEAWGFDLGLRDRQARPAPLWKPVGGMHKGEMFRADRSYNRNWPRILEQYKTLKKSPSAPGTIVGLTTTLRPEDVGGELGEIAGPEAKHMETMGRTHGSRSCYGWDDWGHTTKREGAKLCHAVHSPAFRFHPENLPFDPCDLRPAGVYTLKFRKFGEESFRKHVPRSERVPGNDGTLTAGR
eukprot:gnl/TRDRNA2_/TRDRNA2_185332_c0_seq1.p1 gnl/TRDRNA2_/TRDRNA2_185332_c0~~gnl/TRDRNA2_/TRDRNA2_185332_c0_seq1.p1  ORF type:complete len:350 (+),score=33.79 gnl/TRDRNA2_/TRDRNA2_185332_c0_seq1:80-1129(+)